MTQQARTTLVLGGARSGKSRHAQALAECMAPNRVFIATAQAFDAEMRERIARHQADRDASWLTVEAPIDLAETILQHQDESGVLLIDCLTLWLSNLLLADQDVEPALNALVTAVQEATVPIIFVSNEVGYGIVPDNALARRFRDAAGQLNQRLSAICDATVLVVAGNPLPIKPQ
jgi:adenosylcobinamide kinase/adenosylcobinamide-phosphate guanylyltransferase